MKDLHWIEIGTKKFVAEMPFGRALIEPRNPPMYNNQYVLHLELPSGKNVLEGFYDFETAQTVAWVSLPLLDQVEGDLCECGLVTDTLNLCQGLISRERDAVHWLRIEHIKEWFARRVKQSYVRAKIPIPAYPPVAFDWKEDKDQFYVDTPHGRATITEIRNQSIIGGGIQHQAQIVHPTRASLNCYSWFDFMESEYAIKRTLDRMVHPQVYEEYLDFIDFTLDICDRVLPNDAEPIHWSRLDALKSCIHLALD